MAACASLGPPYGHRMLGGAMYLLVIGLVAVIVAFLVAAFFSMRRGHDDEDEPARRPSVRDRIRSRGGDPRDRDPRWDSAGPQRAPARRPGGRGPAPSRRPARDTRDPGRADRYDRAGDDESRGYEPSSRGYGERAPIRGYDGQRTERAPSARRGARNDDATETVVQSAARPARNRKATPAARPGDDSFGTGPVTALYDTGPPRPPRTATPPRRSTPIPTWPTRTSSPGPGGHSPAGQQGTAAQPAQNPQRPAVAQQARRRR